MTRLKENSVREAITDNTTGDGLDKSWTEGIVDAFLVKAEIEKLKLKIASLPVEDGKRAIEPIIFNTEVKLEDLYEVGNKTKAIQTAADAVYKYLVVEYENPHIYSIALTNQYRNPTSPLTPVLSVMVRVME